MLSAGAALVLSEDRCSSWFGGLILVVAPFFCGTLAFSSTHAGLDPVILMFGSILASLLIELVIVGYFVCYRVGTLHKKQKTS